jgi:hypothetical protein
VATAAGIALALVSLSAGCSESDGEGRSSPSTATPEAVGLRGVWDVTTTVTDTYESGDPVGATASDVWTILESCVSTCSFTSEERTTLSEDSTPEAISQFEGEYAVNLKTAIECLGPDDEVIASLLGQVYETYRFRPTRRRDGRVTEMEGTVDSRIVADTFTCRLGDETGRADLVLRRRPA